jgi:cell division protein FtsB
MITKIKQYQKNITDQISRFGDIRFTGQVVFVAVVFLISWSGARVIQSNYSLQEQVAQLNQQKQLASLENNNIALQNQYYNSNQYLELSGRQNFGLAYQGETELIVPNNVAAQYEANLTDKSARQNKTANNQPGYQKNFVAWVDFFLHRNDFQTN